MILLIPIALRDQFNIQPIETTDTIEGESFSTSTFRSVSRKELDGTWSFYDGYEQDFTDSEVLEFVANGAVFLYGQAEFNTFLSAGIQPPAPSTLPNWQGFLDANDLPEVGGNGIFGELLTIDRVTALAIYQLLLRMLDGVGGNLELRTINFLYGLVVPALAPDRKALLEGTIIDNRIPIVV